MGKNKTHRETHLVQMSIERAWENTSDESGERQEEEESKAEPGHAGNAGVGIKDHLGVLALGSLSVEHTAFERSRQKAGVLNLIIRRPPVPVKSAGQVLLPQKYCFSETYSVCKLLCQCRSW